MSETTQGGDFEALPTRVKNAQERIRDAKADCADLGRQIRKIKRDRDGATDEDPEVAALIARQVEIQREAIKRDPF